MRICLCNLTAGFKTGGLETFTWGFADALVDLGHEVEVVTGRGARVSTDPRIRLVQFDYIPREQFPNLGSRFRKLAERLSFARLALPYVRNGSFDAVLVNKPYDFFILKRLKAGGYGGVTCYNSGGTEFFFGDRLLSKAVDLWFPCSNYNAEKVFQHYKRSFTVLHNGVDTKLFSPHGEKLDLHKILAIPNGAKVIVSVGRLIGLKGVHVVIEAVANLRDTHLVVVGEGVERARLEKQAIDLRVENRVHFFGEVPHKDLPSILRAASLFVQPSIGEEAFGISVAEAMSCGLPVVVSDGWGLREVVTDGVTGVLVKPGDVSAWVQAISNVLESRLSGHSMGELARQRVVSYFTWRHAAKLFELSVLGQMACRV